MNEGVEWAVHCCLNLSWLEPRRVTAAKLAAFHDLPTAYLNKQVQALVRTGIVSSTSGPKGGFQLARSPHGITLMDVLVAIEGSERAFRCTEIRQRGPVGQPAALAALKPCGIARAMWRAEEAWRAQLRDTTVADLVAGLAVDVDPETTTKAVEWLQEVLR